MNTKPGKCVSMNGRHKWSVKHGLDTIDNGVTEVLIDVTSCVHCGIKRYYKYVTGNHKTLLGFTTERVDT